MGAEAAYPGESQAQFLGLGVRTEFPATAGIEAGFRTEPRAVFTLIKHEREDCP